jgi:mannose-1-phosphate guanylyltransferase
MIDRQHVWALVLAAGEGSRLRALTTQPCGTAVPKQFCSLHGGRSLLEDALLRAGNLVDPARICTIVAQQHRQWWSESPGLRALPAANLIVQPRNRGTGIGILYSLLHILAQDRHATVLLLPADHYVRDEQILDGAIREAADRVVRSGDHPVLLGVEPDDPDPELGYVLPGRRDPHGGYAVARFIEKPDRELASEIIAAGALWNTFIIAARAQLLVDMFLPRYAPVVMEMQIIVSRALRNESPAVGWPAIVDMYQRLPQLDFSRDLLESQETSLCVVRVPACGWSDLGTPRRVADTLRRLQPRERDTVVPAGTAFLDLAARHAHHERTTQIDPSA